MVHLLKHFQSYDTIIDLMFDCDYAEYRISKGSITMTEEEFNWKRDDFIRRRLLGMRMSASLINALCHYVLWMYECSTVGEYEGKVKEVAESMKIGNIVFVSGFDDTKQLVWEARIDDHLHYAAVFDNVKEESYGSTPPPFSMNL